MQWSRMDNNWPWNPKFLELLEGKPLDPSGLFWASVAYTSGHDTKGRVSTRALPFIHGSKKGADALVYHGLWSPSVAGWEIKNFAEYQPAVPSAEVRSQKASKAANARWHPEETP